MAEADTLARSQETLSKSRQRGTWFLRLAFALGAIGVAGFAYHALIGSRQVSTENAYVGANIAHVTPLIAGTVAEVIVNDADVVEAGDVLVALDPADARIALAAAEADYARATRGVRQLRTADGAYAAAIRARQSELAKARDDLARRQVLARSGAISGEALAHARDAVRGAEAGLQQARAEYAANREATAGVTISAHPDVARAAAALEKAKLDLERTKIHAPIAGIVARRNVQIGQAVAPGAMLMAIAPVADVFVDANFKESQLRDVRPGQKVTLKSDLYGGGVSYTGRVVGVGGGTGSAFAIIPAQNASGNWIKVVQRIPVRIALDREALARNPLRVGVSMHATIHLDRMAHAGDDLKTADTTP